MMMALVVAMVIIDGGGVNNDEVVLFVIMMVAMMMIKIVVVVMMRWYFVLINDVTVHRSMVMEKQEELDATQSQAHCIIQQLQNEITDAQEALDELWDTVGPLLNKFREQAKLNKQVCRFYKDEITFFKAMRYIECIKHAHQPIKVRDF